ncbi:ABC transporter ATP-binding protein [Thermofilum sp.]|jgi:energy-coupling factor transport system ATP-binding protein|nr:ABC transporter ATP-binding protein [Thermofilum sp.]
MAVIEVKDLSFKYLGGKDFALRGINLEVEKGETILLVGPSGCGKSTLIRTINGLIPHRYAGEYKGSVTVSGVNVAESSPQALSRIVGTVMQEVSKQLVAQTVEDDVAFGPANLCMPREELRRRVEASLKAVGALHLRERDINALSGGEKQRVVFAGILAMDPEVVLLDEPLANLDSEGVRLVLERVEDFKQRGKTIVIAEHRTEEILEGVRVDRIIVMDKGVVLKELDSPEGLAEYRDKVRVPSSLIYSAQMVDKSLLPINGVTTRDSGKDVIIFEGVYFSYDGTRYALENVSLTIREGERVALLGNNGAGKSTMSKLMLGLLKPTKGRVLVDGEDTRRKEPYELAGKVGLVVQDPYSMLFARTVREELAFGPRNLGVPLVEIDRRVDEVSKACGISHLLDGSPFSSSYGEKKRICVGAVLTMYPSILILDEPTAGQDYANYVRFLDFVTSLNQVRTFILITHDIDIALEYTDRTIVLSGGRVIADGSTVEVLAREDILRQGSLRETQLIRLGRELSNGKRVYRRRELEKALQKT